MRMFINRKRIAVFGIVAVLALAAAAVAYWTGAGSGSGTANVGTSGTVTVTATVPDDITPGNAVPVGFTAANATNSPIQITAVHLVSVAADAGHAACETGDFSMADVTEDHQVPAGATAEGLPTFGSLVFANTAVNQDACKGATLTLTLTSS